MNPTAGSGAMTIAFFNSWIADPVQGSGTAVAIEQLKRGLEMLGHRVHQFPGPGAGGTRLRDRLLSNLMSLPLLRRMRFDAVVGFDIDGCFLPAGETGKFLVSLKGISSDEARFESGGSRFKLLMLARLERMNLLKAQRTLVPSRYSREAAARAYGVDPSRIAVVPECIDLSGWRTVASRIAPREKSGMTILSVAHQYRRKDTATLLRAVARLRKRHPRVRLQVVGVGPRLEGLRRLAADLNLRDNVRFLGAITSQERLVRRYLEADLFCLPSLQEGFGIVYLEAMAAGLPIVAARAGATPEVVGEDGQAGLLFEPGDDRELSRCLGLLLERPDLRHLCARNARERVERFDRRKVAATFLNAVGG